MKLGETLVKIAVKKSETPKDQTVIEKPILVPYQIYFISSSLINDVAFSNIFLKNCFPR